MNSYGEVKISDFGLSRDIQQGSMPSFSFLSSMQIPRTPLLAPIITCLQREHLVCLMSISRLFLSIPSVIAPIFGLLVLFYWNAFVDISLSLMSIPIWMYFLSFFPLSYRFNSHIKKMFPSISVPFSYSSWFLDDLNFSVVQFLQSIFIKDVFKNNSIWFIVSQTSKCYSTLRFRFL